MKTARMREPFFIQIPAGNLADALNPRSAKT
jgi:hypothetical protein